MSRKRGRRRARLNPETTRIAIVGAGLSGLSTAICLQQSSFQNIAIYERDASLGARKEGYGLTLTYHPTGILQQLGVLEELANADCVSRSHFLLESSGRIRGYFGNDFDDARAGWGQRGNLRVPRQRVREIMIGKLQATTKIHWDHRLIGMAGIEEEDDDAVRLQFDNGLSVVADLVIAVDGIRSTVVHLWIPKAPRPKSLGVRIILGITSNSNDENTTAATIYKHHLLRERGFYTLAKGMRLFVMPYQGSTLGRSLDPEEPVRFMWQLSFAVGEDDEHGEDCCNLTSQQLQAEALQKTEGWHEPVQSLIRSTRDNDVWGTLLQDQDPVAIQQHLAQVSNPSVIVAGDALHAMSPFKGQGANRCLHDGTVIAKWLVSASKQAAVKGAMREMVQRTAPIVQASRVAAQFWHSAEALTMRHKFAGVEKDEDVEKLIKELNERGVGAETKDMDHQIRNAIQDLRFQNRNKSSSSSSSSFKDTQQDDALLDDKSSASFTNRALHAASVGALGQLRELSWQHANLIRRVVDPTDASTCLHVAAAAGHTTTVHWLVTQAGCDSMARDCSGKSALDVAEKYPTVLEMLVRLQTTEVKPLKG